MCLRRTYPSNTHSDITLRRGEAQLKKRTLTNLYNARPPELAALHAALDAAVFAVYGWPAQLSDEEILERLLALNLQRTT